MDIQELCDELVSDGYRDVWFFRTDGLKDDDGNVMALNLLLDGKGQEVARHFYPPGQPGTGWEMTLWPRGPFFSSLPSDTTFIDLSNKAEGCMSLFLVDSAAPFNMQKPAWCNQTDQ